MVKKLLSFVIAIVIAAGMCFTVVSADEDCKHENTYWEQISDGCAQFCSDCFERLSDEQPHKWVIEGEYDEEEDFELYGCEGRRHRECTCERCGCFSGTDIEPLGHKYVDGVCTRCGKACAHSNTHVNGKKDASCSAEGYTGDTVCDDCGKVTASGTAIAKKDHTPGEVVGAKAATCSEEGYTGDTVCSVCGETIETGTAIAKTEHQRVTEGQFDATCTKEGFSGDVKCEVCGEVLEPGAVLPATGHVFKDGVCEVCGYKADTDDTVGEEATTAPDDGETDVDADGTGEAKNKGCSGLLGCGTAVIFALAAAAVAVKKRR